MLSVMNLQFDVVLNLKEDELVFGEDSLGSLYSDRQGSNKPRLRICFDPDKVIAT